MHTSAHHTYAHAVLHVHRRGPGRTGQNVNTMHAHLVQRLCHVHTQLESILDGHAATLAQVGLHGMGTVTQQGNAALAPRAADMQENNTSAAVSLGYLASLHWCRRARRQPNVHGSCRVRMCIACAVVCMCEMHTRATQPASLTHKMGGLSLMSRLRMSSSGVALIRSVTSEHLQDTQRKPASSAFAQAHAAAHQSMRLCCRCCCCCTLLLFRALLPAHTCMLSNVAKNSPVSKDLQQALLAGLAWRVLTCRSTAWHQQTQFTWVSAVCNDVCMRQRAMCQCAVLQQTASQAAAGCAYRPPPLSQPRVRNPI